MRALENQASRLGFANLIETGFGRWAVSHFDCLIILTASHTSREKMARTKQTARTFNRIFQFLFVLFMHCFLLKDFVSVLHLGTLFSFLLVCPHTQVVSG